mgnify:CR=1 FL=1
MSKGPLLMICVFTFICGLIWVNTRHLTGLAEVLVIGSPIVLAIICALWSE